MWDRECFRSNEEFFPLKFAMQRYNRCFGFNVIINFEEMDAQGFENTYIRGRFITEITSGYIRLYQILDLCDEIVDYAKFVLLDSSKIYVNIALTGRQVLKAITNSMEKYIGTNIVKCHLG